MPAQSARPRAPERRELGAVGGRSVSSPLSSAPPSIGAIGGRDVEIEAHRRAPPGRSSGRRPVIVPRTGRQRASATARPGRRRTTAGPLRGPNRC